MSDGEGVDLRDAQVADLCEATVNLIAFATAARLTADLPYQIKDAIEALKPFGVRVDLEDAC